MTMFDVKDGEYAASDEASAIVRNLVAGAAPVKPPKEWLDDPKLMRATPLTVDKNGRVYGHIATWDQDHIGLSAGVRPPRSRSGYAFFRTGALETAEGADVSVGQLTLAGGHAPLTSDASSAAKHYDDTGSAVADVAVGEDMHGIWVAGALRPAVTAEQIRSLRASAPSGDWRVINGNLELVAVCQVNVPGFPVARGMVASGELTALVAAGAAAMYEIRQEQISEDVFNALAQRISNIEDMLGGDEPSDDEAAEILAKVNDSFEAELVQAMTEPIPADGPTAPTFMVPDFIAEPADEALAASGEFIDLGAPVMSVEEMARAAALRARMERSRARRG